MTITPRFDNIVASGSHTHTLTHTRTHAYDPFQRTVCNHHSKILQHHSIRIAHTHTRIRRMRSVCNNHSKILQHHPIITRSRTHAYDACDPLVTITPRFYNIVASGSHTHTHTHTHTLTHAYDACEPFQRTVCNHHSKILQHHSIRIAHTHTHIRRMRSVCNHHSKILQHSRIRIAHTRIRRTRLANNKLRNFEAPLILTRVRVMMR